MPRPLEVFVCTINELGDQLTPDERDCVMEELPKAFMKTSMLLIALARVD